MNPRLILASGSEVRATLLRKARVRFDVEVPRVDEEAVRASLQAEDATPRDIADALAETKARKISMKYEDARVLGCDQVLAYQGQVLSKPKSQDHCLEQLRRLRGASHQLLSAVVMYENGEPTWRTVGEVRLTMRQMTDNFLEGYIARNWNSIKYSVGGYKIEEEGVRMFSQVRGDYFTVLGLPLFDILNHLTLIGQIDQ